MTDNRNLGVKTCPYCVEVIKSAAVKCRFCQSDLGSSLTPHPKLTGGRATPVARSALPKAYSELNAGHWWMYVALREPATLKQLTWFAECAVSVVQTHLDTVVRTGLVTFDPRATTGLKREYRRAEHLPPELMRLVESVAASGALITADQ